MRTGMISRSRDEIFAVPYWESQSKPLVPVKPVFRRKNCPEAGFPGKMREFTSMSIATLTRSDAPSAAAAPGAGFSRPVVRPKANVLKLMGEVLHHGGPGYLQFAITNICNAK